MGRVSKWAAQLKTIGILAAKWEVPVSKPERLPKRVVTSTIPILNIDSRSNKIKVKHNKMRRQFGGQSTPKFGGQLTLGPGGQSSVYPEYRRHRLVDFL